MILHTRVGDYLIPDSVGEWANIVGAVAVLACTAILAYQAGGYAAEIIRDRRSRD